MSAIQRAARPLACVLFIAGILALARVAYVSVDARLYQANEHRRLEDARASGPAREDVPDAGSALALSPAPREGDAIGEIHIPRIGLTAIVVQGDSAAILRRAVGHLAETALPGEPGNVVLAAHRDTFFRPLEQIRAGDTITLRTRDRDLTYQVEWSTVVGPNDLEVLQRTDQDTLTLITCFPFSHLGPAPDRFIVRAREASFH
jgi:sortase A